MQSSSIIPQFSLVVIWQAPKESPLVNALPHVEKGVLAAAEASAGLGYVGGPVAACPTHSRCRLRAHTEWVHHPVRYVYYSMPMRANISQPMVGIMPMSVSTSPTGTSNSGGCGVGTKTGGVVDQPRGNGPSWAMVWASPLT